MLNEVLEDNLIIKMVLDFDYFRIGADHAAGVDMGGEPPRCHIGHPCTEAEERIGFFDNIVSGSQAESALIDADIVGVVFGNTRLSADGCSDRVAAFFEQLHQTFTESESADFHADENRRFFSGIQHFRRFPDRFIEGVRIADQCGFWPIRQRLAAELIDNVYGYLDIHRTL